MKRRMIQWATILVVLAGAVFGAYANENEELHTIRLDITFDEHSVDQSEVGGELGFAVPMYKIDQLGVFGNYKGYNAQQFKSLGLFIEETYFASKPVNPFLGVGVGYAWTEPKGEDTEIDSVYFRFQGGFKIPINKRMAISAMIMYSVSSDEIFLNDQSVEDKIIEGNIGMRFYY